MPDSQERRYAYRAFDGSGRQVRGAVAAVSENEAFARLKNEGLSPVALKALGAESRDARPQNAISDRDLASMLSDLASLIGAGANIRTAFSILGGRTDAGRTRVAAQAIMADVSGGASLEGAFASRLPSRVDFVASLVGVGEASGELAAGLARASEMLASRVKLRDQFVSVLGYPLFVLVTTIAALNVILFFVIPALEPLVDDSQAPPPAFLGVMINLSESIRANAPLLLSGGAATAAVVALAGWAGLLRRPIEAALLLGPFRNTVGGIVYGGFAIALGALLSGGAPIGEALRLASASVRMTSAKLKLEEVRQSVRQGDALSYALEAVPSFPNSIIRLAAVGEAIGAMGPMISRAGRLEEERALRRIEAFGRMLGPSLIVLLGGVIGLLMAGLLTGVTQLGQSVLG